MLTRAAPVCLYYDVDSGEWRDHGIVLAGYNFDRIACEARHMTAFAVFYAVYVE